MRPTLTIAVGLAAALAVTLAVSGSVVAATAAHGLPLKTVARVPLSGPPIRFDYTNLDQHKDILERTFAGMGWRVPEFLDAVRAAPDMYFDSVARVDVANWSRGRIVLLGDASSCVSLFGDGSTLAIAGAYELAKALTESPADPATAFSRYQVVHGRLVASKQKNLVSTASRIVPRTSTGIWLSARVFWRAMAGVAATMRLVRKLQGKSS